MADKQNRCRHCKVHIYEFGQSWQHRGSYSKFCTDDLNSLTAEPEFVIGSQAAAMCSPNQEREQA